jgi:hypothetical protein
MRYDAFPGGELVAPGLEDLQRGVETASALLVSIGASRLQEAGVLVPNRIANANEKLYALLEREHGDAAHSQYNALIRRLVSFERALESLGLTRA